MVISIAVRNCPFADYTNYLKFRNFWIAPLRCCEGSQCYAQLLRLRKFAEKLYVSTGLHAISHFGFKKMFDSLDVPTFWSHTTLGNGRKLAGANIQLKWSPCRDQEISKRLSEPNANND